MEDTRQTHKFTGKAWMYYCPAFFYALCSTQLLSAASLNQDNNCTATDIKNSSIQTDCQDTSKYHGKQNNIIVNEGEVINVVASNSNKTVIAIEGTRKRDTIINYGEIYLKVTNTGKPLLPLLFTENKHSSNDKTEHKGSDDDHSSDKQPANWLLNLGNISLDAIGIAGFQKDDTITNYGLLGVSAITTLTDEAGSAQTYSIGITGDKGNDQLVNEGQLTVTSTAVVDISDVNFNLVDTGDAQRQAMAVVKGMTGDKGDDEIVNKGQLVVTSSATVDTTIVDVNIIGGPVAVDSRSEAWAGAIGLDGSDGDDHILNQSSTTVIAKASVNSDDVSISLLSALQGESLRSPVYADASAIGIAGGEGHDVIENTGTLLVTADVRADTLELDFSVIDLSSGSMTTASQARVVGIDGGKGKSEIYNYGNITLTSIANTDTDSVTFTLADLTVIPNVINALRGKSAADGSTTSIADTIGISTGHDHDFIANHGSLTVTADAVTDVFEMSMSADGVSNLTDLSSFPDFFMEEPVVDASTTAQASVTGIISGDGHDQIDNSGTLFARAKADVTALGLGIDLPLPNLIPQVLPNVDTTELATAASASAIGITTGEGHDKIKNDGSVWSEAIANANSLSIEATIGGFGLIKDPIDYGIPYSISANLVDVGAKSEATAVGIDTGEGNDHIYSIGNVTARATTDTVATDVAATVEDSDDKVSFGLSLANVSTEGLATALGITSGSGDDLIHTSGSVLADAFVDTNSTGVSVELKVVKDTKLGIGASATRANSTAEVNSVGVLLGEGKDKLQNDGSITAKAHSNVDAVTVEAKVSVPTGKLSGLFGEGSWVLSDTIATSSADGVLGGEGKDHLVNSGTITADSLSDTNSIGVTVNAAGTKKGASIGIALAQAKTEGTATSNGIRGGKDKDELVNTGTVSSIAKTNVDAVSVSASLTLTDKGVALTGAAADGSTNATSTAAGMTGDEGKDVIRNEGLVDVFADADAQTYSVSVAASGASKGVALGLALSRATSEANADSLGISGGTQDDELYNSGTVMSHAKTKVIAGAISLAGGGTGKGLTVEGAAADGSTTGNATATGIRGDQGKDYLINKGQVDVLAEVDTTSVSASVTANGSGTGVTLGIGLARATSEAIAAGTGISGGSEDDFIASSGDVKSHAKSTVTAGSGALAAGGAGKGLTIEGAAADGLSKGYATAFGITGDKGNDYLKSKAGLDVYAEANTTSVSVAVSANGTGTGVAVGVALARAASEAEANSVGISGGDDDDIISNTQLLKSHAKSDVDAVSVSAALGGTGTGVAIQGAAADASTVSSTNATGISGDAGMDKIFNEGTLDVLADADANSVSVGVSVSGAGTGVGIGVSLARTGTQANANAVGISLGGAGEIKDDDEHHHDQDKESHESKNYDDNSSSHEIASSRGYGDDEHDGGKSSRKEDDHNDSDDHDKSEKVEFAENSGSITASSIANADSTSVSVQLGITGTGLQAGGALADASTQAIAVSNGIEGSDHKDIIINSGTIEAISNADANAASVSVSLNASLEGASLSVAVTDAKAIANAESFGVTGLTGNDSISNLGTINANSRAETDATSVAVALGISYVPLGVSYADAKATASAGAFGLDGGAGKDLLENLGAITAHAESDANGISVSVTPIGVALASADINSESHAVGIEGGRGDDIIQQADTGSLTISSHAEATGNVVSVVLLGAAGSLFDDASSTSDAQSYGLSGGSGKDYIENKGSILSEASADAKGTNISANITGATFSDTSTTSISYAVGIDGGADKDKVINEGGITTYAVSSGDSTSISAGLYGYSDADASTTLMAETTGIGLGSGNDIVLNSGDLNIAARSEMSALSVGARLVGVSSAKVNITSGVSARGIVGGEGDDLMINKGAVTVGPQEGSDGWMSQLTSTGFSFSLAGVTSAESSLTSITRSIGLDGEAGNDHIYNDGTLDIGASSYSYSKSTSIGIFGTSEAGGISGAITEAIGIEGGDGEDKIGNSAHIGVATNSYARINAISFTFGGTSEAGGSLEAATRSVGISGGNDKDILFNDGTIDVDATSTLLSEGTSTTIFGTSVANPRIGAKTTALGLDAGNGGGLVKNQASIDVTADSNLYLSSSSFSLAGTSVAKGELTATSNATGISAGDGRDKIWTEQNVTVDAIAFLSSSAGSKAIFGTSDASTTSGAVLMAMGIESGAGNDQIHNHSLIDVAATGSVDLNATSYTFAGTSSAGGTLGALASAVGISGGADDDYIYSEEIVRVKASASLNSHGKSKTTFGNSASNTTIGAVTTVMGLDGGSGNDEIWNKALIDVTSSSAVNASQTSAAFGGGSTIASTLAAKNQATGINAGAGDDVVFNHGNILINSISNLYSNGGASSGIAGDAASVASVTADVDITGIDTGSGHDTIVNTMSITGTATANSSSITEANAGNYFSDGKSYSLAKISSLASGMDIGSENNTVLNQGNLAFNAGGRAFAKSISDGELINNIFGIDQDAYSTASAQVSKTEIYGITGADGLNEIQNNSTINVNVSAEAFSDSDADGDALISGDGTSYAYSYANGAKAYGIKLGHGNNWIMNEGAVTVTTRPRVNAKSVSDADGVGEFREPDSRANAYAYADNALAVGISLGNGDNVVINKGTFSIESAPDADRAYAFGGHGGDTLGIDAFARATASANNATAYGIQVGHGNNEIWNLGSLVVATRPRAVTWAKADAVGFDGDVDVRANSYTNNALAVGIYSGNGNNTVINEGVINVIAAPYANAVAIASPGTSLTNDGEIDVYQQNAYTSNAQAIGIWTGNGNDQIVNKGTITVNATGSSPVKVAVRSGAGNDIVSLEHASVTTGAIELGANDDTLNIIGTPVVNGSISGGSEMDTVVFYGEGSFSNTLSSFENTVKKDLGTYTLAGLAPMREITVEQGVLEIDGDYEFAAGSTFMPSVFSGESSGKLIINGSVNISAAAINIRNGRGHHMDGDRQTVLHASQGILNSMSFGNIHLPDKTPLLEYHHEITNDEIQVTTAVKPFNSVAESSNQRSIAKYMDGLLPEAKGDISETLGEIQAMKAGGHAQAFNSVNPEAYVNTQQALSLGVQQYTTTLNQRTRGLRNLQQHKQFTQPGFFSSEQGDALINLDGTVGIDVVLASSQRSQRQYGSWFKSYRQDGQLDRSATNTGFDFNMTGFAFGFDEWIRKDWVIGGSMAQNTTDLRVDGANSNSDIKSQLFSFYTTYMTDTGYIDGSLSYGSNDYTTRRNVTVGAINDIVISEHAGDSYAASIGGGLYFPVNTWKMELFTSMNYQQQDEDGFQESGAGGISLDVATRSTDLLTSETGIRFGKHLKQRYSSWFTEVGLAWLHDFSNDPEAVQASFVDAQGSSFSVDGQKIDEDGLLFSVGLNYTNKKGFTGSAEYRTEQRGAYTDQIIFGYFQYQFE